MPDALEVGIRFPFGRYAATPWFRSRREHVGNVEWPPSPWRLARALFAVSAANLDGEHLEATHALVRRLAAVDPEYVLPVTEPLNYTQWMPTLRFGDGALSADRLDNGHTLLDVAPDDELLVRWPGLGLSGDERALLDRLLDHLPYLGQSVSVCEARRREDASPTATEPHAWPLGHGRGGRLGSETARLLAPAPGVTLDELSVDTADGVLKSMPAPPGSHWVDYVVARPQARRRPRADAGSPRISAVTYLLGGVLRPAVARPDASAEAPLEPGALERAIETLWGARGPRPARLPELIDDDLDGRAERLRVELAEPQPASRIPSVLAPEKGLDLRKHPHGQQVDCTLTLEEVEWEGATSPPHEDPMVDAPVCFRLRSSMPPLLADAIVVAETFHRRLLGVARVQWGPRSIPSRLSGRDARGERLRADHRHAHVLAGSADGTVISHLMVWARGGFSEREREAIGATTLPALAGAGIRLEPAEGHPALGSSLRWRSALPFLPVRYPKRRGGRVVQTVEDQVRDELAARDLPCPASVRLIERDWSHVRTTRRARDRSRPALGAHGVEIEFEEPLEGPVALGANCHFSMGLFEPA